MATGGRGSGWKYASVVSIRQKQVSDWSKLTTGRGHNWPSWCSIRMHSIDMRTKQEAALAVRCPTCGAKAGEKCELSTGLPRSEPHRDRRLKAAEK